jgi:hypothetical protein
VIRQAIRVPFGVGLLVAAVLVPSLSPAAPDETKKAEEEHRRAAEKVIGTIEVETLVGGEWVKSKRVEKPVLYYGDPTRGHDRGSVWAWGEKGRPVALVELYQNLDDQGRRWVFAICNTSGGKVRASRGGSPWWRANESATEPKDIPGAPAPAADAKQRQFQLKQLARKFTGHQFWDPDNSRFELRRLEQPLHAYSDAAAGVLDGGLYVLANGTNPEILLFVEARKSTDGKAAWRFAVGRLAHAELHLLYDGKEVFAAPRADRARLSGSDKPYWVSFITAAEPDPEK